MDEINNVDISIGQLLFYNKERQKRSIETNIICEY